MLVKLCTYPYKMRKSQNKKIHECVKCHTKMHVTYLHYLTMDEFYICQKSLTGLLY